MKSGLFICLFLFASIWVFADDHNRPVGAGSQGMANASVMVPESWSVFHNQAGLAFIDKPFTVLNFSNTFMLKELNLRSLGVAYPFKFGAVGANYSYFGYELYNESKAGLNFAKSLSEYISLGIGIDYFNIRMPEEYGSKGLIAGEIGLIALPMQDFTIGLHLFNPWRTKIAEYQDERLPTVMRFGLSYLFSGKLLFAVETEKDLDKQAIFKAGIQYMLVKNVFLRCGISNNPVLSSFGIGFNFSHFTADLSFSKHPVLDYSSHIGLTYRFSNFRTNI